MIEWLTFQVSMPYPTLPALALWGASGLSIHLADLGLRTMVKGWGKRRHVKWRYAIPFCLLLGPIIGITRILFAVLRRVEKAARQ